MRQARHSLHDDAGVRQQLEREGATVRIGSLLSIAPLVRIGWLLSIGFDLVQWTPPPQAGLGDIPRLTPTSELDRFEEIDLHLLFLFFLFSKHASNP